MPTQSNPNRVETMVNAYLEFQRNIRDLQKRQQSLLTKLRKYVDEKKLSEIREQLATLDTNNG